MPSADAARDNRYPKWISLLDYIHDQFDIVPTRYELREIIRLARLVDEHDSRHNPAAQQANETISAWTARDIPKTL